MESAQTYRIADWNVFLATRERGRRVLTDVESHLAKVEPGAALALDFAGVEGITVSFGDEFLAKLLLARAAGDRDDRGLFIEGANEDVWETLDTVLERRKISAVGLEVTGRLAILGVRNWLPETLDAAVELRAFSAAALADRLSISPQAANNRLKALVATGAVVRERVVPEGGGKEFGYSVAVPAYA
jgi:hypothetical protein